MRYSTPELVVVGTAAALVQGIPGGVGDNAGSLESHAADGIALGFDD